MGLVAQNGSTGLEYFSRDALGSVRMVTDTNQRMVVVQTFDPYGNPYQYYSPVDAPTFGFTNEYTDAIGLLYLRARYYDPKMGRFFQMDPSRQESNPYQYGGSNPVMFTDPDGLKALSTFAEKRGATVPRKVRELIRDLKKAGFVDRRGRGSHKNFVHPNVRKAITISGNEGDDALHYQEKAVRLAIEEAQQ